MNILVWINGKKKKEKYTPKKLTLKIQNLSRELLKLAVVLKSTNQQLYGVVASGDDGGW